MTKERRLGRGLEALLGRSLDGPDELAASPSPGLAAGASASAPDSMTVAVADVDRNPYQPRQEFDEAELRTLAESLREHGLLQPIVVRRVAGRYQLVAGERRLRAAAAAGWQTVPARLIEADDRQMAELAIVENLQRKDLGPLEKAASFARYLQTYGGTQEELAGRLKLDRSTVANLIRLLELPAPVQAALRKGELSQGHARALLPLGDEREQVEFARRIVAEALSVRETEALVQEAIAAADAEPLDAAADASVVRPKRRKNSHLASLEQQFRAALGTKVEIRQTARGRGRIIVHFANPEEFERLMGTLCPGEATLRAKAG